ncbi:peroxisomal acyl-coenzyme A oxidase 1-like [Portunus trituberculatus]|uniref:peroxisomal acyl-coenzyme A oxidase 1-like n=1 Tax=Portunus trituberculatus TaxID=210409 RepID=UPI001E1D1F55|nr:peroxisomal acyl-coenzyme A oxidase 1-like [Portunus trituberculatus]XP_045124553.1 peroxisomal acyl-coenzyme A oxidase 1-like [Portunus trituberculatus]XP_045124554.1 peroxisomal acyl-coenzyme A oxidase 1-like [Portunus trituberculatus]XP_045124555.1 peroxisomal acyl-coenzyme A oxidase 1-like [Portunus trituberculatus]XP_045124556.1 peroxisomal acyl-coenzyme A oxidase 1-like [Portunus trituberculatus]XP_045124557.1 peroxisomal acyl-coenzyme A oxidase 1-like [Portunus trituberculatus]
MTEKKDLQDCVEELRWERAQCSFDVEELTNIFDGGKEVTARRRKIEHLICSDPAFKDEVPPEYLSHEDLYTNEVRKVTHLVRKLEEHNISPREANTTQISSMLKDGNPFGVHLSMFSNALTSLASPEQQQQWLHLAEKNRIIGTYAQTEMGHGTFLRGLETTATYDPDTKEFVLHSPTITSTKWWPGGLGKTSNTAIVMAQLYTQGKCHGPHPFFVQLRDYDTHRSLPGIILGEIGPRLGINSQDNGYLRFDHCRIPRTNLLMRHSQVLEDGSYIKPIHNKLSYGTMVWTRVAIAYGCSKKLACAVTIATRYSAVRHQSELVPGKPEPQILEYQTQQYKLLPHLASVFAILFSASSVIRMQRQVAADISKGNVEFLPELHILSCAIKALSAQDSTQGIETCRLACGGHGYIASSRLPSLYTSTTCTITYEGENTVLLLQVARYLMKSYRAGLEGSPVLPSVQYLTASPVMHHSPPLSNQALIEAFKISSANLVKETESRLYRRFNSGQNFHHAWNCCSVALVRCAELHSRYYMCEKFLSTVESIIASAGVKSVLQNLCRLYLIHHIILNQGHFLRSGTLSAANLSALEEEMCELLTRLRPQAVPLVDAFDFRDELLGSTLGAWDGRVYERLYEEAQKSPLNKTDVSKAYHKYLRPLMKSNL